MSGDYRAKARDLVISPENARARLARFIKKTKYSLEIYDPNLTDDQMLTLLKALGPKYMNTFIGVKTWKDTNQPWPSTP